MATQPHIDSDWLLAAQAEERAEQTHRELAATAAQLEAAVSCARAKAPKFAQDLIGEITRLINELDPELRSGFVTHLGNPDYEPGVHILVRRNNCVLPKEVYTTIHFRKIEQRIDCLTHEGRSVHFWFSVSEDNEVCVRVNQENAPMMDYKQAARFIFEPMYRLTKRP